MFVGCAKKATYRVRVEGEQSMIIEQPKIKGIRVGDTVQLEKDIFYPYEYSINEKTSTRVNVFDYHSYQTSDGDTAGFFIVKKVAVIESIE